MTYLPLRKQNPSKRACKQAKQKQFWKVLIARVEPSCFKESVEAHFCSQSVLSRQDVDVKMELIINHMSSMLVGVMLSAQAVCRYRRTWQELLWPKLPAWNFFGTEEAMLATSARVQTESLAGPTHILSEYRECLSGCRFNPCTSANELHR